MLQTVSMTAITQIIQECAYQLWENEGRPNGRAQQHWDMACDQLGLMQQPAGGDEPSEPFNPDIISTEPLDPISPQEPVQPISPQEPFHPNNPAKPSDPSAKAKSPKTTKTKAAIGFDEGVQSEVAIGKKSKKSKVAETMPSF